MFRSYVLLKSTEYLRPHTFHNLKTKCERLSGFLNFSPSVSHKFSEKILDK